MAQQSSMMPSTAVRCASLPVAALPVAALAVAVLALAVAVLALAGCAAAPPPRAQRPGTVPAAENAVRTGDHSQAATQYESLAATHVPPERIDLQLAAAREWLAAGRAADAARVLAAISAPQSSAQAREHALLDAETALIGNRAQEAWQKFGAIDPATATGSGAAAALRYYELKMRIALAAGRPADGVRAEIDAEPFGGFRTAHDVGAITRCRSRACNTFSRVMSGGPSTESTVMSASA